MHVSLRLKTDTCIVMMASGRQNPQVYITIKKRKHENTGFKKAFNQFSFTISDVIFGRLKIYI